jgi:2-iminobutanoate/2-iminopropanoate deaminase
MRAWQPISLPPDVPAPKGAYSAAVRFGDMLFVSGQVPRDLRTGEPLGDDIRTQTKAVLENLRRVLEAGGATLDDVVAVNAYLADADDWEAFNEVYRQTFTPPYPTRTTVGARLRGILVEVSAIAVRPASPRAP